jgi:threonine/homoserine/homoserine lactone efflux protein
MNPHFFLRGLVIGFSIAAPVGPIGVLCVRRSLNQGWATGLVTGLGAATADACYGLVAGFGLTLVSDFLVNQQTWLRLVGGGYLLFLGIKTILTKPTQETSNLQAKGMISAYASTFFLTLTNPLTVFSFAAIFSGFGIISTNGNYLTASVLVLGVFSGSGLWWLILSGGTSICRTRINDKVHVWINRASGILITGFGVSILISLLLI